MGTNRSSWNDLMVNHTSLPWLAEGLEYRASRDGAAKQEYASANASFLPIRWNEDAAQTNLYLVGGIGMQRLTQAGNAQTGMVGTSAIEFDRETRQFFGSIYAEALGLGTSQVLSIQRLTAGVAPYLADMDGLHIWLLLQVENENSLSENSRNANVGSTEVTPLLRITYNNVLFQFGSSFNGVWQFDWTAEI